MIEAIIRAEIAKLETAIDLFQIIESNDLDWLQLIFEGREDAHPDFGMTIRNAISLMSLATSYQSPEKAVLDTLKVLLRHGANPNLGFPIYQAIDRNFEQIEKWLLHQKAVDLRLIVEDKDKVLQRFRYGNSNPEEVSDAYYFYAIASRKNAYLLSNEIKEKEGPEDEVYVSVKKKKKQKKIKPQRHHATPPWCYDRFGTATLTLSDGSFLMIGGEHEDYYDPNFCIYNDVLYVSNTGIRLFFYPKHIFPPTDFHTATQVKDAIFIIGNLGYLPERKPGKTPVFLLDLSDFSICAIHTTGDNPGWIFGHTAILTTEEDMIIVFGGEVVLGKEFQKNEVIYALHIKDKVWRKIGPQTTEMDHYLNLKKDYSNLQAGY